MKGKRAAIIGFGGMGQRHYEAYLRNGFQVTAICDIDVAKIRVKAPALPKDAIFTHYQDLLRESDPDILSVVTNGPTHGEITITASEAGVENILCEKPITTNLRDAGEVISSCTKNGTRLAVNHIRRWSTNYRRIRDLIAGGAIGELRHLYFNCGSTGLGNFAIHFLDIARFLTGEEPAWVTGFLDRTGTPNPRGKQFVDPGGYGIISFRNGARFYVDTSEDTGVQYTFQLVGTYGRIFIDELNDHWRIFAREEPARSLPLTRYGTEMMVVPFESDAKFEIVALTAKAQAELIAGGPVSTTGTDGYRSLEMVVGFHASDDRGNTRVNFPLAGEDLAREVRIG
jgi:predicted dehydrogenase